MPVLLEGISRNRFVVLGRAGMDLFADPVGARSVEAETFRSGLGGSSANICAGLSKFGAETALARMVADDSNFRQDLKALLEVGKAAGNPDTDAVVRIAVHDVPPGRFGEGIGKHGAGFSVG